MLHTFIIIVAQLKNHGFTLLVFRLPSGVKKVFHPIICCALSADLAAVAFGFLSQSGLDPVLGTTFQSVCCLHLVHSFSDVEQQQMTTIVTTKCLYYFVPQAISCFSFLSCVSFHYVLCFLLLHIVLVENKTWRAHFRQFPLTNLGSLWYSEQRWTGYDNFIL